MRATFDDFTASNTDSLAGYQLHGVEADSDIAADAKQAPSFYADNAAMNIAAFAKDGKVADADIFFDYEVERIA